MKIARVLTAFAVVTLLLVAVNAGREETQTFIEEPDFYFEDFVHGSSVAGHWNGRDYVIKMDTETLELDLRLVFDVDKGSPQSNHHYGLEDEESDRLQTCPNPRTIYGNESCKSQPPDGFMGITWGDHREYTVGTARWAWHRVAGAGGTCLNAVVTIAGKFSDGVMMMTAYIWERVSSLARYTTDKVIWVLKCVWSGLTCLVEWVWYRVTWVAHGIWDIVSWIGDFFTTLINYVWHGFSGFYARHLKVHVRRVKAYTAKLTWNDVLRATITVFVVAAALASVILTIRFLKRRRQARLEREEADRLAAEAEKQKWRPKQKKRRRKNPNDW